MAYSMGSASVIPLVPNPRTGICAPFDSLIVVLCELLFTVELLPPFELGFTAFALSKAFDGFLIGFFVILTAARLF